MTYRFHEIFGFYADDASSDAEGARLTKDCPFRPPGIPCTKVSAKDPVGVCSIEVQGRTPAITCPVRFNQQGIIHKDVASIAFGEGQRYMAIPEFDMMTNVLTGKRVGKVDWVLAKLDEQGGIADWCLLEVQAVYVSGQSLRPAFREFMDSGGIGTVAGHPDYRSSHVKRLLPQLNLKTPVVRRWGKKVFVAVDEPFYASFPPPEESVLSVSHVVWMVYRLEESEHRSTLALQRVVPTMLDDSLEALYSVKRPLQSELELEIAIRAKQLLAAGREARRT